MHPPDTHSLGNRLIYGDAMRIAAVVAVITLHASGIRVSNLDPASPDWFFAHVLDSFSRWAVPVFVLLSGALLLDPDKKDSPGDFYKKRWARIGMACLFWIAFYFFWQAAYIGQTVDSGFILRSLSEGMIRNHLYFLFIIAGLYAVTPFLRFCLQKSPSGFFAALVLLIFLELNGLFFDRVPMTAATRFIPYIAYFGLGAFLQKTPRFKYLGWTAFAAFLAASLILVYATLIRVEKFGQQDYRAFSLYDPFNALVFVQSIGLFLTLRAAFESKPFLASAPAIRLLGKAAFGIYLSHAFFLDALRHYTNRLSLPAAPVIIIEVIAAFVLSVLFSALLSKNRLTGPLVGA